MQVICEEEWLVSTGRDTFSLNRKQIELLKEATKAGSRGIFWLGDNQAISIPHISNIKKKHGGYWKLENGMKQKIGKEEYERLSKDIKLHD